MSSGTVPIGVTSPENQQYTMNVPVNTFSSQSQSVQGADIVAPLFPKGQKFSAYNAEYVGLGISVEDQLALIQQSAGDVFTYPAGFTNREYAIYQNYQKVGDTVPAPPYMLGYVGDILAQIAANPSGSWKQQVSTTGGPPYLYFS